MLAGIDAAETDVRESTWIMKGAMHNIVGVELYNRVQEIRGNIFLDHGFRKRGQVADVLEKESPVTLGRWLAGEPSTFICHVIGRRSADTA